MNTTYSRLNRRNKLSVPYIREKYQKRGLQDEEKSDDNIKMVILTVVLKRLRVGYINSVMCWLYDNISY